MMIDMKVTGLAIDPFNNMPVIILKDESDKHALPIWIGLTEASAIASELERIQFARPLTHDLLHRLLGELRASLDRIEIVDMREHTFYASIVLRLEDGRMLVMDSRPSDAIALALRAGAPIRVAKKVIEKTRRIDLRAASEKDLGRDARRSVDAEPEFCSTDPIATSAYLELLESLPDKQFGKWKM